MHWTLATLCVLSGLTLASYVITRRGAVGMIVCALWAVQQAYWLATGRDSFALFLVCDVALIAWFLTRKRGFTVAEKLIAATIPFTTAIGAYAWMRGGHTAESWWTGWAFVAGQMLIGLPFLSPLWRRVEAINRRFDPWHHFDMMVRRVTG